MDDVLICASGTVIGGDNAQNKLYSDVCHGLQMLRHARQVGWPVGEAYELYKAIKLVRVGLPFSLANCASKALILDYIQNPQDSYSAAEDIVYTDGLIALGTPYRFDIPVDGQEGVERSSQLITLVTDRVKTALLDLMQMKNPEKVQEASGKLDTMVQLNDEYPTSGITDQITPMTAVGYEMNGSTVLYFQVLETPLFGDEKIHPAHRKIYDTVHNVLRTLTSEITDSNMKQLES